jgi:hypothetical protein
VTWRIRCNFPARYLLVISSLIIGAVIYREVASERDSPQVGTNYRLPQAGVAVVLIPGGAALLRAGHAGWVCLITRHVH